MHCHVLRILTFVKRRLYTLQFFFGGGGGILPASVMRENNDVSEKLEKVVDR